jgi:hypothetical protein
MGASGEVMNTSAITVILFLILCCCISGCTSQPGNGSDTPVIPGGAAPALDQIILQPADVPPNYVLIENRVKNSTDVSQMARDLGWRNGYVVVYQKTDELIVGGEPSSITQNIAIYPAEKISEIYNAVLNSARSQQQYFFQDLPDPGIGDESSAVAAYAAVNGEVILQDLPAASVPKADSAGPYIVKEGERPVYYEIIFTKGDVLEVIRMSGISADYGTALNLSKTAINKMR